MNVEALAAEIHAVYQEEAHRQVDAKHPDNYNLLPEKLKNYDRAVARWVIANFVPRVVE